MAGLGQPLRHDAGGKIAEAAGRHADDDPDRLRGRKLRRGVPRRKAGAAGEQRDQEPAPRQRKKPGHPVCSMYPMRFETIGRSRRRPPITDPD
jgi:hypothetical protein